MTAQHGTDSGRLARLVRRLADARQRADMAEGTGDYSGAQYARAEAARIRRILAEGIR